MGKLHKAFLLSRTDCKKMPKARKNIVTDQGTRKSIWQEPSDQGTKRASDWREKQNPITQASWTQYVSLRPRGNH